MKKIILLAALLLPVLAWGQDLEPRVNANENSVQSLRVDVEQNTADIAAIQLIPGPAGPAGADGIDGATGPTGATGSQGLPGTDLSNEVSILQGEQAVQNDRIDALESASGGDVQCFAGLFIEGAVAYTAETGLTSDNPVIWGRRTSDSPSQIKLGNGRTCVGGGGAGSTCFVSFTSTTYVGSCLINPVVVQ